MSKRCIEWVRSGLVLGVLIMAQLSFANERQERPNILVLISDDHNNNTIGCYGARFKTPHIDRLAKEGVRHTRPLQTVSCAHLKPKTEPGSVQKHLPRPHKTPHDWRPHADSRS